MLRLSRRLQWPTSLRAVSACALASLVSTTLACGADSGARTDPNGGGSTTVAGPGAAPSAVTISGAADTVAAGVSVQLKAVATAADGRSVTDARIAWSTSDTTVARIDSLGLLHTIATGPFGVTVTAAASRGTAAPATAGLSLVSKSVPTTLAFNRSASADTVAIDDTARYAVTVRDGLGAVMPSPSVQWTIDDTSAASVDAAGLVHTRAMRNAIVTATLQRSGIAGTAPLTATAPVIVRLVLASIEGGVASTCGLTRGGSAYCWGEGAWGRLGDGVEYGIMTPVSHPVRVNTADRFTRLTLDENYDGRSGHTCGITTDGALDCWGSGSWGMLADGQDGQGLPPHHVNAPIRVGTGSYVDVAAAGKATCALSPSGDAYCAGNNFWKELGVDTVTQACVEPQLQQYYAESCSSTFVKVSGGIQFSRIFFSGLTACGFTSTRNTYCWGAALTLGANTPTPTQLGGNVTFATLSGGGGHFCGLTDDGVVYCWGRGGFGQLGNGVQQPSAVPVQVTTSQRFIALSAGGDHACAVTASGDMYCWGSNTHDELGTATTESCNGQSTYSIPCSTTPVKVNSTLHFVAAATGSAHTCGLTSEGSVYCWGGNSDGQLGNHGSATYPTPVRVADTN